MEILTALTNGIAKLGELFGREKCSYSEPVDERRSTKRYFCWEQTYFFQSKEDYEDARIIDISMGGVRFSLNHDRFAKSSGNVLLMYDKHMFNMPVKIAWTKRTSGRYEYGAQFLETSTQKQQLLKLYLRKLIRN